MWTINPTPEYPNEGIGNITFIGSVSNRVAKVILRVCKRYSLKITQMYAPTATHAYKGVEAVYWDIMSSLTYLPNTQRQTR